MDEQLVLSVSDLRVHYHTINGVVRAVNGVSFELEHGQILGLVGESGSGKTTTMLSILRLLPKIAQVETGKVSYKGRDVLVMPDNELRRLRWKEISIVFQGALNALNPVHSVGAQISEAILKHSDIDAQHARDRTEELLVLTGLDPERSKSYPSELSGGQRQRVMIAMALAANPSVLIADEPVTALDVIVQSQIMELLRSLRNRYSLSMIIVTHDLGVIAQLCHTVAVMYAGRIVEYSNVVKIFKEPLHPYTKGLIASFPRLTGARHELISMPGHHPNLLDPIQGCSFADRCPLAREICVKNPPPQVRFSDGRFVECFYFTDYK